MKSLVVCSSKTGNTRRVAEAVARALGEGTVLATPADAPDYREFDLVAVGFWIEKGRPNQEIRKYLRRLKGKKVALFFTLGADPASEHARRSLANACEALEGNEIVGHFFCQGKPDPALLKWLRELPADSLQSQEYPFCWTQAIEHPDAADLERAGETFRRIASEWKSC